MFMFMSEDVSCFKVCKDEAKKPDKGSRMG